MLKKPFIAFIKLYSYLISPLIGKNCRFYPTCSAYAQKAIAVHGVSKGLILSMKRIGKCHPWHHGDMHDEVPSHIAWGELLGYKRRNRNSDPK